MPTSVPTGPATGSPIDYQKVFVERVSVKRNGPTEPDVNSTGGELLHGFLCDIYRLAQASDAAPGLKESIEALCRKWNVNYVG